jgi:hypothetical protein
MFTYKVLAQSNLGPQRAIKLVQAHNEEGAYGKVYVELERANWTVVSITKV